MINKKREKGDNFGMTNLGLTILNTLGGGINFESGVKGPGGWVMRSRVQGDCICLTLVPRNINR